MLWQGVIREQGTAMPKFDDAERGPQNIRVNINIRPRFQLVIS